MRYSNTLPPDQEILFRLPEVISITGRRRAAIYRDIAAGEFPRPVRLGSQSVAWKKSDVDRWIATRPIVEPRARQVDDRVVADAKAR